MYYEIKIKGQRGGNHEETMVYRGGPQPSYLISSFGDGDLPSVKFDSYKNTLLAYI